MDTGIGQLKVTRKVIKFVAINMVNKLVGKKFSPKFGFHDGSMFGYYPVIATNNLISLSADRSFAMSFLLPVVRISVTIPAKIMAIAHSTLLRISMAIKAFPVWLSVVYMSAFVRATVKSLNLGRFYKKDFTTLSARKFDWHIENCNTEHTMCQEEVLNNRVNCWEPLTDYAEGNQQPSLSNGKYVDRKVQRLTGEEPTNNPDTSARPERDDIVWTYGRP